MRFLKDYFYIIALLSLASNLAAAKLQPKIVTHPLANTILTQFSDSYGRKSKKYIAPLIIKSVDQQALIDFCSKKNNAPDVYGTSRRLSLTDLSPCHDEGIQDFIELKMGSGALITLASPQLNLKNISHHDLYKIVTRFDYKEGNPTPNSTKVWGDVSNKIPFAADPIRTFVPNKASTLRDIFDDRILLAGCQTLPEITKIKSEKPKVYQELCLASRSDSVVTEANLSDKVSAPSVLIATEKGMITFAPSSALNQPEVVKNLVAINGFKPTLESIKDEAYPLAAPIYLYVKISSLKTSPGLRSFLKYIYSRQNKDHSELDSSGYIPLAPEEMSEQFHLVLKGKPNYQLGDPQRSEK
ncbi:MAG: substrate-binding domain-containing protein [Candidatus Paracaedibacteraceae bacterium]|nr:substrate-binding domain-containing protein [Candidatus Paracaedibacteraceae bacterium]